MVGLHLFCLADRFCPLLSFLGQPWEGEGQHPLAGAQERCSSLGEGSGTQEPMVFKSILVFSAYMRPHQESARAWQQVGLRNRAEAEMSPTSVCFLVVRASWREGEGAKHLPVPINGNHVDSSLELLRTAASSQLSSAQPSPTLRSLLNRFAQD